MPTYESLILDGSIERSSNKYRVAAAIQAAAALGLTSRQLSQGADFPIAKYTPGSPLGAASLTNANVAQSIRNAYAAAVAAGGGNVLIPPGRWEMGSGGALVFEGQGLGPGAAVWIKGCGSGVTTLAFPTPWTTTAVHFYGSGDDLGLTAFCFGGMEGLSIFASTADDANTGIAIKIDACVYTTFRDVDVRNMQGGIGWQCRDYSLGGGHNSQYVQFYSCRASGSRINYDFDYMSNSQAFGLYSGVASECDFLFGQDNMFAVYGGFVQTGAPIFIRLAGAGGNRLYMSDIYYEGSNPTATAIKCEQPSFSSNAFKMARFDMHSALGTFLDVDSDATSVELETIYFAGNATKFVKARNLGIGGLMLHNCPTPANAPSAFDLDAVSATRIVASGSGDLYAGTATVHGALNLGLFAEGAEPGSPTNGMLIQNNTTKRPRMYSGAAWSDVALRDDPSELNELLSPYCVEILDPALYRLVSIIGGELDAITGYLHGSVISALSSGVRPVWTQSDKYFGGQPSLTCDDSTNRVMSGTLSTTIAIGHTGGLFVVGRPTSGHVTSRRAFATVADSPATQGIVLGVDDLNVDANYYQNTTASGGNTTFDSTVSGEQYAHVVATWTVDPVGNMNIRVDGSNHETSAKGTATHALSKLYIGSQYDGSGFTTGSNVALAYVAVLKDALPDSVYAKALKLARQRFGIA